MGPKSDGLALQRWIGPRSQSSLESTIHDRLPGVDPSLIEIFLYSSGITKILEKVLTVTVREHDLDGTQLTVLFVLWCADPPYQRSPTELHRMLVLSPAGVSHVLRRLGDGGYVTRVTDESDGRAKGVRLTNAGIDIVGRCMRQLAKNLDEALDTATAKQRTRYASTQREIVADLSRSPYGRPTPPKAGVRHGRGS